jgi:zinc D-Ala-D-Ala dipeptidase
MWFSFLALALCLATAARADPLPAPYVYLRDIDASIQQDMRYAGRNNFLGRVVPGYEGAECILTRPTADALVRVQQALKPEKLSLKVYDCYRPVQAVRAFEAWAEDVTDTTMRAEFYPDLDKRTLFSLGYISRNSTHSKGNTVDLTIVPLGSDVPVRRDDAPLSACTAPTAARSADNSLDFGTAYDCFSTLSHTAHPAVTGAARGNRDMFVARMKDAGFRNYSKEWWHFALPGAGTDAQDFPVRAQYTRAVPRPIPVSR